MDKIPMWKKIAYGSAAGGGNVLSTSLGTFLLSYYTDTAMIGAAAIGTMFLLARILDGVTDLAMGAVIDKTNTKLGKARPWLIVSAPIMAVGFILILKVPATWSEASKLVYAYVTYIFLMCVCYTIFGIAHAALLARISIDPKDRNTTSAVAAIINNLVGAIVGTAMTYLVLTFGWGTTSIILAVIMFALILVTCVFVKETIGMTEMGVDKSDIRPMKEQLSAALKNKYFYLSTILGAIVLVMTANAIGAQVFYCNVVLQEPMFMTLLMAVGQAPGILVLFLMPVIANRFSKRNFMLMGCVILIIGFSICGFAGKSHTLLLIGSILRSFGLGPMFASLYAFTADATDFGEWKSGIRSEGLMGASSSIGAKIGIGVGSGLTGWILGFVGYDPTAVTASETVIKGITFDFAWLGVILTVVLFIGTLFMDVEKYQDKIKESLLAKQER
jgi:GPH family glycoside/pentoside/hexuronide:cation symporter